MSGLIPCGMDIVEPKGFFLIFFFFLPWGFFDVLETLLDLFLNFYRVLRNFVFDTFVLGAHLLLFQGTEIGEKRETDGSPLSSLNKILGCFGFALVPECFHSDLLGFGGGWATPAGWFCGFGLWFLCFSM